MKPLHVNFAHRFKIDNIIQLSEIIKNLKGNELICFEIAIDPNFSQNEFAYLAEQLSQCPAAVTIHLIPKSDTIKLNHARQFIKCIKDNIFPSGISIHFNKMYLPDDYGQDELAYALKSNTNIVYLDFSAIHGSARTQATILHCLKRNRLLHKYPQLAETILALSFKQNLYLPPEEIKLTPNRFTSQLGLFAGKNEAAFLDLPTNLDEAQRRGLKKMLNYGY